VTRDSVTKDLVITRGPERIVCLTEETTELLYLLGEERRIVGISAFTERPKAAKRDKPVVSAFTGGSVKKICALEPDLVIGFSDIQAELARELIAANQPVLIWNQRSVQQIVDTILAVGRLVDAGERAAVLVRSYLSRIETLRAETATWQRRPRVYFEEWDEPTITAIGWVSELIEIAGGDNVFAERAAGKLAKERFVSRAEVLTQDPEIVLACWCGKPFDLEAFQRREGFSQLTAVQHGRVYEVPPEIILQPGPAALSDGLSFLESVFRAWRENVGPAPAPQ
jgi:iron complex transport system substrate-binding protein